MSEYLKEKDYYQLIDWLRSTNDPVERFGLLQNLDKKYSESNSNFRYSLLKHLDELISEKEYRFCQIVDLNPQMSYDQIALGAYPYQYYLQIREEIKSLNSGTPNEQGEKKDKKPESFKKYTAKYHVLTYSLDADAAGRSRPNGNEKTKLEKIGAGYFRGIEDKRCGNTFAKNYTKLLSNPKIDINKERDLINNWGENWREIVLSLSQDPSELNKYLKNKQL